MFIVTLLSLREWELEDQDNLVASRCHSGSLPRAESFLPILVQSYETNSSLSTKL